MDILVIGNLTTHTLPYLNCYWLLWVHQNPIQIWYKLATWIGFVTINHQTITAAFFSNFIVRFSHKIHRETFFSSWDSAVQTISWWVCKVRDMKMNNEKIFIRTWKQNTNSDVWRPNLFILYCVCYRIRLRLRIGIGIILYWSQYNFLFFFWWKISYTKSLELEKIESGISIVMNLGNEPSVIICVAKSLSSIYLHILSIKVAIFPFFFSSL